MATKTMAAKPAGKPKAAPKKAAGKTPAKKPGGKAPAKKSQGPAKAIKKDKKKSPSGDGLVSYPQTGPGRPALTRDAVGSAS